MPHISVQGCDTNKCIQQINIHAEVVFSREMWVQRHKADVKLDELKDKIEALVMEYFDIANLYTDTYSNHEWNSRMNNY